MTDGLGDAASGMIDGGAQGSSGVVPVVGPMVSVGGEGPTKEKRPLYPRLLRLRHVHPNAWQRAVLGEGALGVAALLCLADVASLWTLVVLPVAVAGVVKAHDLLAGRLADLP